MEYESSLHKFVATWLDTSAAEVRTTSADLYAHYIIFCVANTIPYETRPVFIHQLGDIIDKRPNEWFIGRRADRTVERGYGFVGVALRHPSKPDTPFVDSRPMSDNAWDVLDELSGTVKAPADWSSCRIGQPGPFTETEEELSDEAWGQIEASIGIVSGPPDLSTRAIPENEEEESEKTERPSFEVRDDGDIFINRRTRTIVTDLGEFGTVVFSFERHAQMRRRYADDWENSRETIPEIARDFDMQPAAFNRYKTLHGWTHASDPFTDEEWEEGLSVEAAVAQTLASHRRAYHKQLQKEKWAETIADADRWRRFDESVLQPVTAAIEARAPRYAPPRLILSQRSSRRFDVVLCPTDLHYGKGSYLDECGSAYSCAEAARLIEDCTRSLLQDTIAFGVPERIITAVGSDWLHIDTDSGTTTSGTPQDMDGTPQDIHWEGAELAIQQIDMLRQVAPVEVLHIPGNHDRMAGWGVLHIVYSWFRSVADVHVTRSNAPRQYIQSGDTLLGFAHGDGAKFKDLPLLMATEARELWGKTQWRTFFTGHLHYELTKDTMGVIQRQLPSLSGSDRWHVRNGYVGSRRALTAYIVDHRDGVIATLNAPAS